MSASASFATLTRGARCGPLPCFFTPSLVASAEEWPSSLSADDASPPGNSYAPALIFLYVARTSDVWNGGVPTRRVYRMTPMLHTSTSYE